MFASYLFGNQHRYAPVRTQSKTELPMASGGDQPSRRRVYLQALFLLEAAHLLLLLAAFTGRRVLETYSHRPSHELDTYFDLFRYDTVKSFYGDGSKMNRTAESEALFEQIQTTDGVVAIDTEWALQHGYSPSMPHPADATKSIYQIDMFHSMHCIFRLRNKLTSRTPLAEWPRDDEHTLHCLDYMREQLMCNADLTLEATEDLLHFNINSGHVCRSSDTITAWAAAHHWADHRHFLKQTTNYE